MVHVTASILKTMRKWPPILATIVYCVAQLLEWKVSWCSDHHQCNFLLWMYNIEQLMMCTYAYVTAPQMMPSPEKSVSPPPTVTRSPTPAQQSSSIGM